MKKRIGVLVAQFPISTLNNIMTERAGLGETGETYLIGMDGKMRSDSYLDPENHSVLASFRNPKEGSVDTVVVQEASKGIANTKMIENYKGNSVLFFL